MPRWTSPATTSSRQKALESYSHVWWMVQRIARAHDEDDYPEHALVPGDERPTFAHVGRLWLFAHDSQTQMSDLARTVNKLPETITYLAFVVEQEARSS
jgi:hypothetical protein